MYAICVILDASSVVAILPAVYALMDTIYQVDHVVFVEVTVKLAQAPQLALSVKNITY